MLPVKDMKGVPSLENFNVLWCISHILTAQSVREYCQCNCLPVYRLRTKSSDSAHLSSHSLAIQWAGEKHLTVSASSFSSSCIQTIHGHKYVNGSMKVRMIHKGVPVHFNWNTILKSQAHFCLKGK